MNSSFVPSFLVALMMVCTFGVQASPLEQGKVSVMGSVAPQLANQDVDHVDNSDQLDNSAYLYQLNYVWPSEDFTLLGKAQFEYYSLRAFKFIEAYTEDGTDGASELEGIALLYGQRYMMTRENYEGFGLGWYAGLATGTDRWIEPGEPAPVEDTLTAPLAAGEAFYKQNFTENFYGEVSLLAAINKQINTVTPVPFLMLGAEF